MRGVALVVILFCVLGVGYWVYRSPSRISFLSSIISTSGPAATTTPAAVVPQFKYLEVVGSCGPSYVGDCVLMRSGPGTQYPVVARLRTGVVLLVGSTVTVDGHDWYKIQFAAALQYPERVKGGLYVSADMVQTFLDPGDQWLTKGENASTTKRIVVDVSQEMLYAYDGDVLFMQEPISTGLEFTPTPRGTFLIFKKTPARYMQGPLPGVSDQVYDLPGVPWDLYFTQDGAVIHGAYWHDHFGEPWSHGCVNLSPQNAKKLYMWAEVGVPVTVQD